MPTNVDDSTTIHRSTAALSFAVDVDHAFALDLDDPRADRRYRVSTLCHNRRVKLGA